MAGRSKKSPRQKDITGNYLAGDYDEDRLEGQERFGKRSKHAQENKTAQTALTRSNNDASNIEMEKLPIGEVIQVHSLFIEVEFESLIYLCVARKTLYQVSETKSIVVGDRVRFLTTGGKKDEQGHPEAVIEQILPRQTLLTRSDSFKQIENHPIVANAEQMLIVTSILEPAVKWGLVDRMIIAAQAGGLMPIVCLNKMDLAAEDSEILHTARAALDHYRELKIAAIETSINTLRGLDSVKKSLLNKITVLAGHSGVGKSSLIRAIQPSIDIRVGEISGFTGKGRHTTTSARRYILEDGGTVIDTPGVKLFGLWGLSKENLIEFFPDVTDGTAPDWRRESYERIEASI